MSHRSLPSLDLLRGFEASARQLSFTRAAEELFLTQSAVSRQVQALEEHLGVPLFERRHREIRLTDAGQQLYRAAGEALRLITDAADRIRSEQQPRVLTVSCTIGFASLWLVPRLAEFRALHPDIEIRIDANQQMLDLERERVEIAVRFGTASLAPPGSSKLFGEEVLPVCSPALLGDPDRPLAEPADLRHHVLLHFAEAERYWLAAAWSVWLETMNQHGLKPAGSLMFNQYDQLLNAALEGQGVALAVGALVQRHLRQGRLVALFGKRFATPRGYFLVIARYAAQRPDVIAFTEWLRATAERERSDP
jgi:LysR family transcriptional regulator, glycine cleavage system transcriptional activator